MIDPHSPDNQLTLPLNLPDWIINHTLACPTFIVWMMPFVDEAPCSGYDSPAPEKSGVGFGSPHRRRIKRLS